MMKIGDMKRRKPPLVQSPQKIPIHKKYPKKCWAKDKGGGKFKVGQFTFHQDLNTILETSGDEESLSCETVNSVEPIDVLSPIEPVYKLPLMTAIMDPKLIKDNGQQYIRQKSSFNGVHKFGDQ